MYAESSLLKFMKGKKIAKKSQRGGAFRSFGDLLKGKETFMAAIFATLIFELVVAFGTMKALQHNEAAQRTLAKYFYVFVILQFVFILLLAFLPMPPSVKFVIFTLFSLSVGTTLSKVAAAKGDNVVKVAVVGTMAVFATMLIVGIIITMLGINLGWLAIVLFFALLLLIVVRIVFLFMKESSNVRKGLAILSIILFGMFIIFDTNNILQRDYNGDFVTAAIDYFLDILNIFVSMTELVNQQ
jgi:FtsH-binding integral membrane protein